MRELCGKSRRLPRGRVNAMNMAGAIKHAFHREAQSIIPEMLRLERDSEVAAKTGASKRTVDQWRRGDALPGIAYIGPLIAAYPQFRAFFVRWIECAEQPDFFEPRSQREYHAFLQMMQRRR